MAYYVICDDDSRHESMTKEQILAAIAQALETGKIGECDTGFVTKVKETNGGNSLTFWVGTQAQYNALEAVAENCLYIISDDTSMTDFNNIVADLKNTCEEASKDAAKALAMMNQKQTYFIYKTLYNAAGQPVTRKFSDGYAESFYSVRIQNVPITESYGSGFYAMTGGLKKLGWADELGGVKNILSCSLSLSKVKEMVGEEYVDSDTGALLIVAGEPSDEGTQKFAIISAKSITQAEVSLQVRVRWKWEN